MKFYKTIWIFYLINFATIAETLLTLRLNKMKTFRHIFFFLIIFFSCDNDGKDDFDQLIFRYNEHKNINSLDPAFAKDLADIWGVHQLFNGLVQMDSALKVMPSIAKSWTISDDALTYDFIIRDDVFFHKHQLFGKDSTRAVKAQDFEYSFKRILNPKLASPGSWVFQKVDSFKAINDTVFRIKLKQTFPAFLGLLTMKYCSVVPKEITEYYGSEFRSNPIGTGPFKFKRWEENIKLVFRKNNHYFERGVDGKQLPYLEAISITFLPDKQSEFLQFAQGNIDFVSGLDDSYKDEILTESGLLKAQYVDDVSMLRAPYLNTEYLAFYLPSELNEVQSKLLREAINYGFDREKMIKYLRNGIGIPAQGGFIPKGLPGYQNQTGFSYQPELAKQRIEQFKTETGIKNPELTLTTNSNYLSFCEYIQKQMELLGLKIKVDVIPSSSLKDAKSKGQLDFFRASWVADYPDAENYLSLFYSKNLTPYGSNYTHYQNPIFDAYYEQSLSETNFETRTELYQKMDSLVINDAPIVPLYYDEVVRFKRKNITGLGINPINLLELKQVRKN